MRYGEHLKEGWRNLCFARLRSGLALLGVLVGTASVVAMVLGGDLATNEAMKEFKTLGTDLLAASLNADETKPHAGAGKREALTLSDALNLPKASRHILQVAPYTQSFQPIYYEGKALDGVVLGVTEAFAAMARIKLLSGRFVSWLDQDAFYCVIGRHLYDLMKQASFKNPLGKTLQVGNQLFVIVGVADAWPESSFVYANIDEAVLVPLMASMMLGQSTTINNIIFRLTPEADIAAAEIALTRQIERRVAGQQVTFRSARELIAQMKQQNTILTVFLGSIGGISLLVGGVGVMNIMLVSVIERRREIGIRLAVGARRADIGMLFLMESVMLSLVGGSLGVLLGVVIAYILASHSHWQFIIFWWPILIGFSVSVAVGVFFGCYPAYQAARLNPIEALRLD